MKNVKVQTTRCQLCLIYQFILSYISIENNYYNLDWHTQLRYYYSKLAQTVMLNLMPFADI